MGKGAGSERPDEILDILQVKGNVLSDSELRLFVCFCAGLALPIFENSIKGDKRPRRAVEVAVQYAAGKCSLEELEQARQEAEDASNDAPDLSREADAAIVAMLAATTLDSWQIALVPNNPPKNMVAWAKDIAESTAALFLSSTSDFTGEAMRKMADYLKDRFSDTLAQE